jgi:diguanylate cyclase (GGDEF)-like protein
LLITAVPIAAGWSIHRSEVAPAGYTLALLSAAATAGFLAIKLLLGRQLALTQRLRALAEEHEASLTVLAARNTTVNGLLDFSQTIQGAGKADQVYTTLAHYLQSELALAGVAIIAWEPDSATPIQLKAALPDALFATGSAVCEMDTALCPCLRQAQPRSFRADGSPVRCAIDAYLSLPPSHPAYCIPLTIGRKVQVVAHMLLPPGAEWTEQLRQLAQTYANTAQSSLITLHLLSEAEQQSLTDSLTSLYNRRSLDQLLQREVALAERHQRPLSVVMIDMDLFKQVNDEHGHAAGDYLLRAFADCVRMTLRKTDLAFRYGGDEFVIALPHTPLAQAEQVVNKLRQAFAAVDFSSAVAHLEQQPTLSIGVAERSAANNVLTLGSLLSAADAALYEAKSANRNCVRIYQPPKAA